jgi:regulatory protein
MKITALKQQVKNPERVSIFIDEKYDFSLSLDELVKYKLRKDQELSAGEIKKFKKISADGKLRARALEWLLIRPHSEREFKDYLYRKKAEPDQIESLVTEFTAKKYLDDAKFALWFVDLQARRGKSTRAIRSELYKKGISGEVAGDSLAGDSDNEVERLKSVIEKKQNLSRYKNDKVKFIKYLTSQGFNYSDVKRELEATDN